MSPLKLSRTTSTGTVEEEVELDPTLTEKVEKVLKKGVTLDQAFTEGMEAVAKKHGNP